MPRTCTVCAHPKRSEIDRALLDGMTYRTIADRFGLSETALKRHKAEHVPARVAKAKEAKQVADADDLLSQLKALRNRAVGILQKAESALRLELTNGSRVISLPASEATIRGYSAVDLLLIDEASRVDDALYASVRPMLATSNGRLVAMSTPWGRRGWWYEAWRSTDAWHRTEVKATDCPRISAAFLEEEQRNMGQWFFAQEYMCEFLDAESAAFRSEDIEAAFTEDIEQWRL